MKIYIENYGCSANYNNGEIIAGLLKKAGHKLTSERAADIIILNTCTVKTPTENKILKRIRQVKKHLIVTGCMPSAQADLIRTANPNATLIGIHHIKDIVKAVKNKQDMINKRKELKLCLPKIRKNKIIDIVQISEGCKGNCSYCITRLAKGKLVVYPDHEIIKEIESAIKEGCKEIWLTSQDTAAYPNLPLLLNKIARLPGEFKIRLGMANPNNVLPILNPLIRSFSSEKIFKFLHIPVQSGNDQVLRSMNRYYKIADFKKIVREFRKVYPEITIATDIICGFPGETEKQFDDSLRLIEEIKPGVLNISRFWPRPGTEAENMKQHPSWLTKERSKQLTKLFNQIASEENKKWVGWEGKILIDEKGKNSTCIGRNDFYRPVIVKGRHRLGQTMTAKVRTVTAHDLRA